MKLSHPNVILYYFAEEKNSNFENKSLFIVVEIADQKRYKNRNTIDRFKFEKYVKRNERKNLSIYC